MPGSLLRLLVTWLLCWTGLQAQDLSSLYREAMSRFERDDFRAALTNFLQLKQKSGKTEFEYYIGFCRFKLGNYAAAEESFRSTLRHRPDSWQAQLGLGRTLFHLDRLDEAESALSRAAALRPGLVETEYHLGLIYFRKGEYRVALGHFGSAIEADPFHLGAAYNLGQSYARLGDTAKARLWIRRHQQLSEQYERIEALRKAASFPSSTAQNWIALGSAYLEVNLYDRARAAFQKAARLSPTAEINRYLGFVNYRLGDFSAAVKSYEQFLRHHQADFDTLFNFGQALRKSGAPDRALEVFKDARRARPTDPVAWVAEIEILLELERWPQALSGTEALNARFPDLGQGHFLTAFALWKTGQPSRARESAVRAVQLEPRQSSFYLLLAEILEQLGQKEEALQARKQAQAMQDDTR